MGILPYLLVILIQNSFAYETIFLVDHVRHAARSHYQDNRDPSFFDGAQPGGLTRKGKSEHMVIGIERHQEYVVEKQFLSDTYDPKQILSVSTYYDRCAVSGEFYLHGLYPFQDLSAATIELWPHKEAGMLPIIKDTTYERIFKHIDDDSKYCPRGPVVQVPFIYDKMMHTRNCARVHNFLNKDEYNITFIEELVESNFDRKGIEALLEPHFNRKIETLKNFFVLVDAYIAELYQMGVPQYEMTLFQRAECIILSNNFAGDPIYGKVYLSRLLVPMATMIQNAIEAHKSGTHFDLKLVTNTMHDTNLSNTLRFLGYFDDRGYFKVVRFSSSLRFEVIFIDDVYRIRTVFDGLELHHSFCSDKYCDSEEFLQYFKDNLIFDFDTLDAFCEPLVDGYTQELKF